jgi:hypothetical protein
VRKALRARFLVLMSGTKHLVNASHWPRALIAGRRGSLPPSGQFSYRWQKLGFKPPPEWAADKSASHSNLAPTTFKVRTR